MVRGFNLEQNSIYTTKQLQGVHEIPKYVTIKTSSSLENTAKSNGKGEKASVFFLNKH